MKAKRRNSKRPAKNFARISVMARSFKSPKLQLTMVFHKALYATASVVLTCQPGKHIRISSCFLRRKKKVLVEWIEHLDAARNPISRCTIKQKVHVLTKKIPGKNWIQCFLKRHPVIKPRWPSGLDPKCAQCFNKQTVKEHFELAWAAYLVEELITDEFLKYIHNMDCNPVLDPYEAGYEITAFLACTQHIQYAKTGGLTFISNYQGM
jgi:hypothetical protein